MLKKIHKGRWAKSSILLGGVVNPSVSFADSSLYTREPWALPRQLTKLEFGGESPLTMRYGLRRSNKIISRPVASFRSAYGIRQT